MFRGQGSCRKFCQGRRILGTILSVVGLGLLCACAILTPLPPVDLSVPGWQVRQGQAVWKPRPGAPEIAGDLLVATRSGGDAFIQFSKTLPIATARKEGGAWEASFGPEGRRYSGRGRPPRRIIWFAVADVALGHEKGNSLDLKQEDTQHFTLQRGQDEWLEVFLGE